MFLITISLPTVVGSYYGFVNISYAKQGKIVSKREQENEGDGFFLLQSISLLSFLLNCKKKKKKGSATLGT